MATEELPSSFDVIVLGTGLPESIVSAALSRIGKKVLHLDRNSYYGSNWATHSLAGLLTWIQEEESKNNEEEPVQQPENSSDVDASSISLALEDTSVKNVKVVRHIKLASELASMKGEEPSTGDTESSTEKDRPSEMETDVGSDKTETNTEQNLDDDTSKTEPMETEETPPPFPDPEPSPAIQSITSQAQIASRSPDITFEDLESQSRKFNLDLAPKLLLARGTFVEALINANITHYAEFRTANRILSYRDDQIIDVPCSRADVFSSTFVSVLEKRLLMKFLTFCLAYQDHPQEYKNYEDKEFVEFLRSKKLTEKLQFFVTCAIAMLPKDAKTLQGLDATQRFLHSLGRYSNSPFLWAMYGIGELPQAFCRMSAVFGGMFCLRKSIRSIRIDTESGKCGSVTCTEGEKISTSWIVMNQSYVPGRLCRLERSFVSRAIVISNRSIKASEDEPVTLLTMETEKDPILVIEVGPASCACPRGLFVVNLTCQAVGSAEEDLSPCVERLFDTSGNLTEGEKPNALWCLYFNQDSTLVSEVHRVNGLPENILITGYPDASLGVDDVINKAKEIFELICPDEEFLPAVPNPEDIIFDDGAAGVENQGGFGEQEAQGQLQEGGEGQHQEQGEGQHQEQGEEQHQEQGEGQHLPQGEARKQEHGEGQALEQEERQHQEQGGQHQEQEEGQHQEQEEGQHQEQGRQQQIAIQPRPEAEQPNVALQETYKSETGQDLKSQTEEEHENADTSNTRDCEVKDSSQIDTD